MQPGGGDDAPSPDRSGMGRSRRLTMLVDVGVVVVLVGFLAGFLVLRHAQQRHDGDADAAAKWALEHDAGRVAWPERHRGAVDALIDAGVEPVLVDDGQLVPQHLAVNATGVVVARSPDRLAALGDVVTDEHAVGDLVAARIDLDAAGAVPLAPGQVAGEEISRPFRYSPLRPSRCLGVEQAMEVPLHLAAGTYHLEVEAFDPDQTTELSVTVRTDDGEVLLEERDDLDEVVWAPTQFPLQVPRTTGVTLRLTVDRGTCEQGSRGDGDGGGLLHAWRIERQS